MNFKDKQLNLDYFYFCEINNVPFETIMKYSSVLKNSLIVKSSEESELMMNVLIKYFSQFKQVLYLSNIIKSIPNCKSMRLSDYLHFKELGIDNYDFIIIDKVKSIYVLTEDDYNLRIL